MTLRDLRQTAMWAVVTSVLVIGVLDSRVAQSFAPLRNGPPSASVNGCKLTAEAKRSSTPNNVALVLRAENPWSDIRRFDVSLTVIREDFVGNPMSRTIRPNDYKRTTESKLLQRFAAAGRKTSVKTILVPVDARPPAKGKPDWGASYIVQLEGKKASLLAKFPANIAWQAH